MVEVTNLLYIVVEDDDDDDRGKAKESFRYTRPVLQSTLQLMGCKARHAFKISKRVFELIRNEHFNDDLVQTGVMTSGLDASKGPLEKECDGAIEEQIGADKEDRISSKTVPFELYKRRTTVVVRRDTFLDVVCDSLTEYKYVDPNRRADLILACRIREKKESVTVLLCGTSGCGKSTLSALLASRLGITTVISTDSIRHMMRGFVDEKENPLVWASTYHAGEFLDPVAVAEAKAKRKVKKLPPQILPKDNVANGHMTGKSDHRPTDEVSIKADLISPKQMAIEGFKAQSEMVIESLDRLITAWEERKESVVVEGVHLSLNFVMGLMKKHPSIIPFMIYITNEEKHLERFAVRAKYMTLDPAKNKYAKYIQNIRTIQEYLCLRADKHLVPKINNTNVDKSVAAIHATVFGCLRRRAAGGKLLDPVTNTVALVDEEYRNQCTANSLSSKGMFQLIQRQGSSRHMMALINDDGSVAKTWPVNPLDSKAKPHLVLGSENGMGTSLNGHLQIGKAESVNLQFGHFSLSGRPNDSCGTSHAASVDELRHDGNEAGSSRYYSSCCSSPRMSDGPAKELKEDDSVNGSDEEVDDPPEVNSDDDLSDNSNNRVDEEMEGSVDEGSTKSDEEYDDLAMEDVQQSGYWSDDDEETKDNKLELVSDVHAMSNNRESMYKANLDRFLKTRGDPLSELPDNQERSRKPHSGNVKSKRRSMSIPSGKNDPIISDTILSGFSPN